MSLGCGLVYKLDKTGKRETVLYRFTGTPDGQWPVSTLIQDSQGNLYGMTWEGGFGIGTVFKLSPSRKEKILFAFQSSDTGDFPAFGVVRGKDGNLYGTTAYGGSSDNGVIFELTSPGNEKVLVDSSERLSSPLIMDPAGNFYGVTGDNVDNGFVYELSPNSNHFTVLYTFCSQRNCTDGELPSGGLVRDAAGNLYGTTARGGSHSGNCGYDGCGVVFKLDTAGHETVLHTFTGGADGSSPDGGMAMDAAGRLYGTTNLGGDLNCQPAYGGCGVVFKITP